MLRGMNEFIVPPKVFGCTCFVRDHRPSVGKLDPRAVKCIFVGYSSSKKGYNCWCPTKRHLFVSMDVTFRESELYYGEKSDFISLFELEYPSISEDDQEGENDTDIIQENEDSQSGATRIITGSIPYPLGNSNVNERQVNRDIISTHARKEQGPHQVYTRRKKTIEVQPVEQQVGQPQLEEQQQEQPQLVEQQQEQSQLVEQPQSSDVGVDVVGSEIDQSIETGGEMAEPSNNLPIALRKEARSTAGKPPTRYGFEHDISNYVLYESLSPTYRAFIASLQSVRIPKDWKEAIHDPKWHEAMFEELRALEKNKTWDLVKLPTGKNAVSCKWIFTVKQNPEGKVERYKARLVARGYSQTYGIDYDETFAPVAKMSMVRTLISCAANFGWPLH
ncbi:retrotransposon protein, putative, unclassified [Panicum miliaceum]|uniref:Retrotransposon protein, putative, unclassified n=1 Tax=Panicum miliaceum TaxID=4540 RepID=A0A3L6RUY1_PANMI|nr:retrotransposon protein, putative, unclassified [Panicum miliaceum]